MNLRWYQQEAHDAVMQELFSANPQNCLVQLPTGTGKSVSIAYVCRDVMKHVPTARILMLTHVKELVEQNAARLKSVWPNAPLGVWSAGLNKKDTHTALTFAGVGTVAKNPEMLGRRDIILIDEAHRVSPRDSAMYSSILNHYRQTNPHLVVVGYTATGYRLGQGLITDDWFDKKTGETVPSIFKKVAYDLTRRDDFIRLIREGHLAPLVPRSTEFEIDVSNLHTRNGDYVQSEVEAQVNDNSKIKAAVDEIIQYGFDRRSWLVFAAGVKNAELVADEIMSRGFSAAVVSTKTKKKERDRIITEFKSGRIRCLVNNDVLTTGFDYPALDMIAVLRATQSTALWCLSHDTEILTSDGWKTKDEVKQCGHSSKCASVNPETLAPMYLPIKAFVERHLTPDEHMLTLQLPKLDVCVSNKHNMLVSGRKGRRKVITAPELVPAELLVARDYVRFPVSCVSTAPRRTGLCDDALTFIGIWLADGTLDRSNNSLAITASDRYPQVQEAIIELGTKLGLALRVSHKTAEQVAALSNFSTAYGQCRYRLSYTSKKGRGWKDLAPFIDKNISDILFSANPAEFKALLRGIALGDGSKHKPVTWTPRTVSIAAGNNKRYAERLQIMCILNGYSCSLRDNGHNCYLLHIKAQNWKVAKKPSVNDTRNTWQVDTQYKELVWCVENDNGTLITRRNGKVVIMGNCQILGRGTRPCPEAGKHNCLVLDFAGNTKRLGTINDPVLPKPPSKSKEKGECPVRVCPHCGVYNHASARVCDACGKPFPPPESLETTSSMLELISTGEPIQRTLSVTRVKYETFAGHDGTPLLRVTYYCGKNGKFVEFINFTHKPQLHKALDWWKKRTDNPLPINAKMAYALHTHLRQPAALHVWLNKPKATYPVILNHIFTEAQP